MDYTLPGILVTGASGFVGRNFIKAAAGKFRLFCIARRSMAEAGVQNDDNLRWTQVDIGDWEKLKDVIHRVNDHGGVDYTVHFAGYYDFTNENNPEYLRTNVFGTKNILELSRLLNVKRFLFASSLAACTFPPKGTAINEESLPDADIPYAWSKREAEKLVKEYAQWFPCTIIRLAAIFSDWCEYPPLYALLNAWLSGVMIKSRILAGRGESALPYIHVQDVIQLYLTVIEKSDKLQRFCTFNASPNGATSHLELFKTSTQFYYGRNVKPIRVPRLLLGPMLLLQEVFYRLIGRQSFEQLWMLSYVDKQLAADSSRTTKELSWQPTPRKCISRRLLFLIENMKKHPEIWRSWNEAMLRKEPQRPYLVVHEMIYDAMVGSRDDMVKEITANLVEPESQSCSCSFIDVDDTIVHTYVRLLYQLIATVIKTRDRPMMQQYAKTIAFLPSVGGFGKRVSSHCLFVIGNIISEKLRSRPEFRQIRPKVDDYITMTIQLAIDQIEDQYELLTFQSPKLLDDFGKMPPPENSKHLESIIHQLENLCAEAISGKSWTSPLIKS
jgi:nucleoside-diphosphate-sugar epimerase